MDTTSPKKPRKSRVLFIATRDGQDCGIKHADELGLGRNLCLKRGLLVPSDKPKLFTSFSEMNRMMTHTQKAYATLKGSMVDQHPRLKELLGVTSAFKFRKVVRKRGALVSHVEDSQ